MRHMRNSAEAYGIALMIKVVGFLCLRASL